MSARTLLPLKGGLSVEDTARRLANYLHVLREVHHLAAGHLALEPRLEIKLTLGDHLYDDARAISEIRRRLTELGTNPGAPSDQLAKLLDRARENFVSVSYGELKPALIAALKLHLDQLDPLADEPGLRLLTALLHRQERHIVEIPPPTRRTLPVADLGALATQEGERELTVSAPVTVPARDGYVSVGEAAGDGDLHAQLNHALCAAELAARNSHEHPGMPWEFHVDMARHCWDSVRHAEIHDRLLAQEGRSWGDAPVSLEPFTLPYAKPLAERLESIEPAEADLDFITADNASNCRRAQQWAIRVRQDV